MPGRQYSVIFENVAVAAAQDLFELTPATNKPIKILGILLSNVGGAADAGDAQEEFLRLTFNRGNATSGSGGSAPTPIPLNASDAAAGFTAEVNNTTRATAGTKVSMIADGINVRLGYPSMFTPETMLSVSAASTLFTVGLEAAPADSINLSGTLYVEEF